MRFMLTHLLEGSVTGFPHVERAVPDIHQSSSAELARLRGPRYLKSHEPLTVHYPRVIYLVRHPVPVCASYFEYELKQGRARRENPAGFFTDFLDGGIDAFGDWGQHVGGWIGARSGRDDFLLVRYEDRLADTASELRRVADFLALDRGPDAIQAAVDASGPQEMQRAEKETGRDWGPLQASDPSIPFVRAENHSSPRFPVPPDVQLRIVRAWGRQMDAAGYAST